MDRKEEGMTATDEEGKRTMGGGGRGEGCATFQ